MSLSISKYVFKCHHKTLECFVFHLQNNNNKTKQKKAKQTNKTTIKVSINKRVNYRSKDVIQTQQETPESPYGNFHLACE